MDSSDNYCHVKLYNSAYKQLNEFDCSGDKEVHTMMVTLSSGMYYVEIYSSNYWAARSEDIYSIAFNKYIPRISVTGVALNKTEATLNVGDKLTLQATVSPSNATTKTVVWQSSNTSVATVSNGIVTAKAAGTATITVTTKDKSKKAACKITVKNPASTNTGSNTGTKTGTKTDTKAEPITIKKAPKLQKPTAKKKRITVTWKPASAKILSRIKKIEVQVSLDKKFTNIVYDKKVGKKKTKLVVKKLQRLTRYYVRARYVGKAGVSKWSKVKKIKTK